MGYGRIGDRISNTIQGQHCYLKLMNAKEGVHSMAHILRVIVLNGQPESAQENGTGLRSCA
jgi:hypothetical protein